MVDVRSSMLGVRCCDFKNCWVVKGKVRQLMQRRDGDRFGRYLGQSTDGGRRELERNQVTAQGGGVTSLLKFRTLWGLGERYDAKGVFSGCWIESRAIRTVGLHTPSPNSAGHQ